MDTCEIPRERATPELIRKILTESKVIAVVGLSPKPHRDSHRVAAYLQAQGYRMIPVNPNVPEVLGERAWPSLRDIPEAVDVVDIFRRAEEVPEIVEAAIKIGAKTVWMQQGIVHNAAADLACMRGLQVVMSRCMMTEHKKVAAGV